MFERADWTMFRNINTISQKAGVPAQHLRRLMMKELVDNALDAVGACKFGKTGENTYWVEDEGPGLNLPKKKLEELFSINRPLTSSKVIRKPSRGALGNGLRVVVGIVMSTGGQLKVDTNGRLYQFECEPQTGKSRIIHEEISPRAKGTKITVTVGKGVPKDSDDLFWAILANNMGPYVKMWDGPTNAHWYDSDSFFELLMSAGERTVNELLTLFGFDERKARTIVLDAHVPNHCSGYTRKNAEALLKEMRKHSEQIKSKQIGTCDWTFALDGYLTLEPGHGEHWAKLPYKIEAFAKPVNQDPKDDKHDTEDEIEVMINGTPITGEVTLRRQSGDRVAMFGCGVKNFLSGCPKRRFKLWIGIFIPYMPITTDGKEPNLAYLLMEIEKIAKKATGSLKAQLRKAGHAQGDVIRRYLEDGIKAASGDGMYRYSLRQLFYAIRPHVLERCDNGELDYTYFAKVITDIEASHGEELPGIYRDPRGTLYHPHLSRSIPIGTIAVEEYERPDWTFNKILYCEKEGFFSVLQQVKWPERHDCALLSSKGFASRAVRDVLDLLGETEQEIQFFCIHDADASGTLIYQALTEGTTARAARKVKIINLGLDPWEAVENRLQIETFSAKKALPVAKYVKKYDEENDTRWAEWLQNKRVELNAMTSPQFLSWLDRAIAPYSSGKLVPPEKVLKAEFKKHATFTIRENMLADLLKSTGFEQQVQEQIRIKLPEIERIEIGPKVTRLLERAPEKRWDDPVRALAKQEIK
jgi:hypothetical protein